MDTVEDKIATRRESVLSQIKFARTTQHLGYDQEQRDAATRSLPGLYRILASLNAREKVALKRRRAIMRLFWVGVLVGIFLSSVVFPALCWVICR